MRQSRIRALTAIIGIILTTVLLSLGGRPVVAHAQAAEPFPCDAAHDGAQYYDRENGVFWECKFFWETREWAWALLVPPAVGSDGYQSQVNGYDVAAISGFAVGLGAGFSNAEAYYVYGPGNPVDVPAGWITEDLQLEYWNGSSWITCADSGWYYTSTSTWGQTLDWSFGSGSHPCNDGYYGTFGAAFVWDGAEWAGGWQWSGYAWCGWHGPKDAAPHDAPPAKPTKAPPKGPQKNSASMPGVVAQPVQ